MSIVTAYWKTMKYRKEIKVTTNDPLQKNITFVVQAHVQEILSTMPPYVNFGHVKAGTKQTMVLMLINNGKNPIHISQIKATPASQVTIAPRKRITMKAGDKVSLMVTFMAGKDSGIVNGSLLVKSDLPSLPEKPIFVQAVVDSE